MDRIIYIGSIREYLELDKNKTKDPGKHKKFEVIYDLNKIRKEMKGMTDQNNEEKRFTKEEAKVNVYMAEHNGVSYREAVLACLEKSEEGEKSTEGFIGSIYELKDIEVFGIGEWNKHKITGEDLDNIVNGTNEIIDKLKPRVKLGHDDKQGLLQKFGYPAGGWITKLKRAGNKILVDIKEVPKVLYQLIKNGAYKRISSEILYDYTEPSTKKKYAKVLSAIAFLGADLPAVTNLKDIAALFSVNQKIEIIYDIQNQNRKEVKKMTDENNDEKKFTAEELKVDAYISSHKGVSYREAVLACLDKTEEGEEKKEEFSELSSDEIHGVSKNLDEVIYNMDQAKKVNAFSEADESKILEAYNLLKKVKENFDILVEKNK